jgi:hypothetical protein
MNSKEIFSHRAFILDNTQIKEGAEEDMIRRILLSLPEKQTLDDANLVASSDSYDSYRVEANGHFLNVKISFDSESPPLLREIEALKEIPHLVGPRFIHSDQLNIGQESLLYFVSSWDNAPDLSDFGRDIAVKGCSNLANTLKQMPKISSARNFPEYLGSVFESCDFQEYFFDDSIDAIKDNSNWDKIASIIRDFKSEATSRYTGFMESHNTSLCHGNLCMSNVLSRSELFMFRNFDNVYVANQWFDVCNLILNLGLSGRLENNFVNTMSESLNLNKAEYKECLEMSALLFLLNLFIEYFKEVYIFSSQRLNIILEIISMMGQNIEKFKKLSVFRDNHDFIVKTLTEPILGIKS